MSNNSDGHGATLFYPKLKFAFKVMFALFMNACFQELPNLQNIAIKNFLWDFNLDLNNSKLPASQSLGKLSID